MKVMAAACMAMLLLVAPVSYGSSLDDANSGLNALNHQDYAAAAALFRRALREGSLSAADQELAHVKLAEAEIHLQLYNLALSDLHKAASLDRNDQEAINLTAQAEEGRRLHPTGLRTAGDLARLCASNPNTSEGAASINSCDDFAQGAIYELFQGGSKPFCIPAAAPGRYDTMREFAAWVRASPSRASENSMDGFRDFMSGRFPCR